MDLVWAYSYIVIMLIRMMNIFIRRLIEPDIRPVLLGRWGYHYEKNKHHTYYD